MLVRRAGMLVVVVLLAMGLAAACGGGGGSGSGQPAGSIKVTMTEFKFDPSSIHAGSGKATFYLVNAGTVAHDMVVLGPSGTRLAASELVQAGNSSVFTVNDLKPGTYQFICDQPGHESAGMKGTLTVT